MYATVSSKIYESDRAHCVIKIEFLNLTELAKWANDFAHWQSAQQKMTFIETVKLPEGTLKLGFVYILKLMNKQYKQSIFEQFKRHTHTIRYLIWFQYGFNWLFHDEIEHIYDPLLFVTWLHSMALSGKTLRRHVHVQQFEIAKHAWWQYCAAAHEYAPIGLPRFDITFVAYVAGNNGHPIVHHFGGSGGGRNGLPFDCGNGRIGQSALFISYKLWFSWSWTGCIGVIKRNRVCD